MSSAWPAWSGKCEALVFIVNTFNFDLMENLTYKNKTKNIYIIIKNWKKLNLIHKYKILPKIIWFSSCFCCMISGRFVNPITKINIGQHFQIFPRNIFVDWCIFEISFTDFIGYLLIFLRKNKNIINFKDRKEKWNSKMSHIKAWILIYNLMALNIEYKLTGEWNSKLWWKGNPTWNFSLRLFTS